MDPPEQTNTLPLQVAALAELIVTLELTAVIAALNPDIVELIVDDPFMAPLKVTSSNVFAPAVAKAAMETFKKVFGKNKTMGLYSGDKRELDCDFIFSTIQTISKFTHLENFTKDHFDYIIIDEKGEIIKLGSSERLINSTEVLDFIKQ